MNFKPCRGNAREGEARGSKNANVRAEIGPRIETEHGDATGR